MRILCTGDVHIGRRSSETTGPEHSCAEAWMRICRLAVGESVGPISIPPVDLVVVSGDLTDEHNRYYEAIGPIERGLAILKRKNIPVVVVAGNHDHDTLLDVHRVLNGQYDLCPLGVGGKWESLEIGDIRIFGWSYPAKHFHGSPLVEARLDPSPRPTLGLFHVQRFRDANYAFALPSEFRAVPAVHQWLIGHIHKPEDGPDRVLNPGSPQAMDANEQGWHGVWLLTTESGAFLPPTRIGLSTVWFESLSVQLTPEVASTSDLKELLFQTLKTRAEEGFAENPSAAIFNFRLHLEGRCPLSRKEIETELNLLLQKDLGDGRYKLSVTKATVGVLRPVLDLRELAEEAGPRRVIARALLALEHGADPGSDEARLLRALQKAAAETQGHSSYLGIRDLEPMSEDEIREVAREQGYQILELLEAQS